MKPADQDQLVEDLKREYPAASQVPVSMKKAREVIAGYYPADEGERWYGTKQEDIDRFVDQILSDLKAAGFVILPREPDEGTCEAGAEALRGEFPLVGSRRQTLDGWGAFYSYRAMVQHYESKGEAE